MLEYFRESIGPLIRADTPLPLGLIEIRGQWQERINFLSTGLELRDDRGQLARQSGYDRSKKANHIAGRTAHLHGALGV